MKVLTVLGNHALAIELALTNKFSPAHALSDLYRKDKPEAIKYVKSLQPQHCLDFAQYLIAAAADNGFPWQPSVPDELSKAIFENRMSASLVKFYLNDCDLVAAIKYLTKYPEATKQVLQTNANVMC